MKGTRFLVALAVLSVVMMGCAPQSSDLSPNDDAKMRQNMTRSLTPEEIAQASSSPKSSEASPPANAAAPPSGKSMINPSRRRGG